MTVVSTFHQTHGKGYAGNVWESSENQNLTFSVLLVRDFDINLDLPVLNMWITMCIQRVLTYWHIKSKIKWPNDIIVNGKKIGGILIENKIIKDKIRFSVVGIGLNIYQTEFYNLKNASSIINEYPKFDRPLETCLMDILNIIETDFPNFVKENYQKIRNEYHNNLYKRNVVAAYEINNCICNGVLKYIDTYGNAVIELESLGTKTFRHKQIKLRY